MENPDCFFIVDTGNSEENPKIQTFCVSCFEKDPQKDGWFWEGSKRGYGPYLFKCCKCDTILFNPEE
jgi:hypothetical protein